MATVDGPGEAHASFMEWAISQGVEINGVAPARFPGRGLGMVATRNIEEGETIVAVPLKAMLTVDCIPSSFVNKFIDGISVHGLIAAFLTHGDQKTLEKYELWRRVWPSRQDFEDCMPILWPERSQSQDQPSLQILSPPSISGVWSSIRKKSDGHEYDTKHQNLLAQQKKRLQEAWNSVRAVFPDTDWETFSYYWLIVNTRSFFYLQPDEDPPEDRNDAMALVPFADYFNHADDAKCDVNFDGKRYTFRSTKPYGKGEEIYMSYGPHSNDFLLTEYGFYLEENESDAVYLDDIIFRDLSPFHREELSLQQYYGNYQLSSAGACFRTEIAACMTYMTLKHWRGYVLGRSTQGVNAKKTNAVIARWIRNYIKEAEGAIATLETIQQRECKAEKRVKMLLGRWRQIKGLCENALRTTVS